MRFFLLLCVSVLGLHAEDLVLEPLFPNKTFKRPIAMLEDTSKKGAWYVAEQSGKVWYCPEGKKGGLVLDLSKNLGKSNEEGLLSLIFSPNFTEDKQVFIYYSLKKPRTSIVASFILENNKIDRRSEVRLLEMSEPYGNHNGGQLAFGPEGYLYIGVGDGGKAGDPHKNGQNLKSLHGKILRIDPFSKQGDKNYGIPSDNPLVKNKLGRGEIYAWGLRNPWRFSFDRLTGEIICADVGQNKQEEIDYIVKGGNYGWNKREGSLPFASKEKNPSWREPFFVYGRKKGISVTGGFVYRGESITNLKGWYICSDFATGRFWLLEQEKGKLKQSIEIDSKKLQVASFSEDQAGELYLMSYAKGTIYKLKTWKRN